VLLWDLGGFEPDMAWSNFDQVLAHEVGHLLGRGHSPAGHIQGLLDRTYPYPKGTIGAYGLDLDTRSLLAPKAVFDFLGYQSPRWTSDYTWREILEFLTAVPPPPGAVQDCLLIQAKPGDGTASLVAPVFQVTTVPLLPTPADYTLEGRDGAGELIFSQPFGGHRIGKLRNPSAPDHRHSTGPGPVRPGRKRPANHQRELSERGFRRPWLNSSSGLAAGSGPRRPGCWTACSRRESCVFRRT